MERRGKMVEMGPYLDETQSCCSLHLYLKLRRVSVRNYSLDILFFFLETEALFLIHIQKML